MGKGSHIIEILSEKCYDNKNGLKKNEVRKMNSQLSPRERAQIEADEYWDIYDENRIPTGKKHRRGDPMKPGEYHLDVHVCVFNSKGQLLIQQRQPFKRGWPNLWDLTVGGSALSGETSRMAAQREIREELGLEIDFTALRPHMTLHFEEGFDDYYFVELDVKPEELSLQEEEVKQVRWVEKEEVLRMRDEGIMAPYLLLEQFFEIRKQFDCRVFPEGKIEITTAEKKHFASWMNMIEVVKWNFPGLETEEEIASYQATVLKNMERKTAICALCGNRVIGTLLYSPKRSQLSFLAVHPNFRRKHIAEQMVNKMIQEMDDSRDIIVETFREDDPKAEAPRAFYRAMGFVEGDPGMENGYPVQSWIKKGRCVWKER